MDERTITHLRRVIYIVTFIYTINFALTLYINSSFLGEYLTAERVSVLFSVASLLAMLVLTQATKLYVRIGQHRATQWFLLINVVAAAVLAVTQSISVIVAFWILFYCTGILLRFDLDVYMEKVSANSATGRLRGVFLTVLNLAIFVSPFIAGRIVGGDNNYALVYFTAAGIATITLLLVSTSLRGVREVAYTINPLGGILRMAFANANLRNIIATTFLLEFFYSWMVIYTPIYLHQHIGFDWATIGIILSIMLIPFVLIEYPLGKIADLWLGEQEILIAGLALMGVSTAAVAIIGTPNVALFAGVLFVTRIGAAAVEIMNESYFFKHVDAEDAGMISFYRLARPLAYIAGPLLGALVLSLIPFSQLFLVLGVIMLGGIFFAMRLVDTK